LATDLNNLLYLLQIRNGSRIGQIVQVSERKTDQIGLKPPESLVQFNGGILRKTEVQDFDPVAFFLQNPDQISQPQGKDRIGHLLSIDGDEENFHG
jgi:hypothetical protein